MAAKKEFSVFLVDDDSMYRQMLEDKLGSTSSKSKLNIKSYSTGEACLEDMDLNPDIIVLDYHLNKENPKAANGIQILKKIKVKRSETQVVILSGQDKLEVAVDTIKYGAYDYVVKNESAFVRAQDVINKIIYLFNLEQSLKYQKRMIRFVSVFIITAVIVTSILYVVKPELFFMDRVR